MMRYAVLEMSRVLVYSETLVRPSISGYTTEAEAVTQAKTRCRKSINQLLDVIAELSKQMENL
jgi:hypothetical protein